MITLFRLMVKNYLKAKWECAFWMTLNKTANEFIKNPEVIEQKIMPFLAEIIHNSVELEKLKETNTEYLEKVQK